MSETIKNKLMNFICLLSLLLIICFPKINIIPISGTYVGIRVDDIIVAIFSFFLLLFSIKDKFAFLRNEKAKKIIIIFAIYIIWCLIASAFGIFKGFISLKMSALYIIRKIEYFLFFFMGYYLVKDKKNYKKILFIIYFSVIFHTIYMLLNRFGIIGTYINGAYHMVNNYRQQSTFNGPYEFSAYMTLIEPLFIYKLFDKYKTRKDVIYSIICLLCMALCIFLSESRTSLIIYVFVLFAMPIYYLRDKIILFIKNNKLKTIFIAIITIIILGFASYFVFNTERFKTLNLNNMKKSFDKAWENRDYNYYGNRKRRNNNGDISFNIRITKWADLLDLGLRYPITGCGVSVSKEAIDGNYIRIFCESGIIGLIIWIIFIIAIFKLHKNSKNKFKPIVVFGMVTLLLQAIFIDIFEASKIMMLYYLLLGYSLYSIDKTDRKKIKNSVVMATYNGEKYIDEQIKSILTNMKKNDELIISDDGSTDKTISIIKKYQKNDKRIKLIEGPKKGVKMNFQNAIEKATGDNIFLADQDDVWMKDKIKNVSKYLEDYNVVTHNALIVDKDLKGNNEQFFKYRKSGKGIIKNIYKNTYIGCCMAFRSDLKEKILPIPNDIEMHDQWIGIIGEKYGDNIFIDDCLIQYRRHDSNVSKMTHHPLKKMLKNRITFIKNYIKR